MHSRIFQITKEKLDKTDWIIADHYYDHWFTNRIADYVNDDINRKNDLDWFFSCMDGVVERNKRNKSKFKIINKLKYFESRYERFLQALEDLCGATLQQFAGEEKFGEDGLSFAKYRIDCEYNDEFGFYVDDNREWAGLDTMDEFMRRVHDGDEFYIGGVVDYHW